ncbi:DUF3231 family protein [Lederbergia wuyishanensis]|uniref:DUF3231 family protein n=1 Tax=Lederbergia wuyishanensis TaxID=1347903 RepID=A0ABU0DAF9_9BACI|nr:DUF3231 family protein [Lederbergia wuyishanensis]MCJ8009962.1 DUF3231 family protein [Lederbergia wuyishanensis]MDQ0345310.1 hypothetical protein [Lederbergia wuyishanensis]
MTSHEHIKLTASELSNLFTSYLEDTLVVCVTSYFLEHVDDPDMKECIKYAQEIAIGNVDFRRNMFKKEELPIPVGFSEQDVNVKAPRLYSDEMMLQYVTNLAITAMGAYSSMISVSARHDIRDHYTICLHQAAELFNRSTDLLLEKGLFIRSPYIPYPSISEFVEKKHFLAGWWGDQRPLTSMEISFLYLNLFRNSLGGAFLTGFSQVAESKAVRKFMVRGAEIAKHHEAVFWKFLSESNITTPVSWSLTVTRSQEPVFSDKLLMFHTNALNNVGMSFYGQSLAGSPRRDLTTAYSRLMVEIGEFVSDGTQMMIDNGWLEKPPSAPNREELAKG